MEEKTQNFNSKLRSHLKKYQYEYTLFGAGLLVGRVITKRLDGRQLEKFVEELNDQLEKAFDDHKGNFTTEAGYVVPIIEKN